MRTWEKVGASSCVFTVLVVALVACSPSSSPRTPEERLRAASTGAVTIEHHGTGVAAIIGVNVPVSASASATPSQKAMAFLTAYGDVLGVSPMNVTMTGEIDGDPSMGDDSAVVTYQQTVGGVPVDGSDVRVEVSTMDASADSAISMTVPMPETMPSTTPTVTAAQATAAVNAMPGLHATGTPRLEFLDIGFVEGGTPTGLVLVWVVQADSAIEYIDATTGAAVFATTLDETARMREIYDAGGSSSVSGVLGGSRTLIYNEAGLVSGATATPDTTALYDTTGRLWNYYWNTFKRDGHDGRGALVRHHANFIHTDAMGNPSINATWRMGQNASLFDPGMITDDVCGHELTHGLVEATANLKYVGWSGALNESYADVFGSMFERANWTIGEGCALGTIRDMSNPPAYGQPNSLATAMTWPAGTAANGNNDWLGVHTNSGVFNYAAYLATDGGIASNGQLVVGIGRDKVEQIYFRALTWYTGATATPQSQKIAVRLAAYRFAQHMLHGVTPEDCGSIINSFAAVGIGGPDNDDDCFADTVDNCPTISNFDQADSNHNGVGDLCEGSMMACQLHLEICTMDSECCDSMTSMPAGTMICELGECVDGASCVRVGTTCSTFSDCCEGVPCEHIGSTSGPKQCCARSTDPCTSSNDCCGAMLCDAGKCVCRTSGESCVSTLDCCGSSYCDAGTCS